MEYYDLKVFTCVLRWFTMKFPPFASVACVNRGDV